MGRMIHLKPGYRALHQLKMLAAEREHKHTACLSHPAERARCPQQGAVLVRLSGWIQDYEPLVSQRNWRFNSSSSVNTARAAMARVAPCLSVTLIGILMLPSTMLTTMRCGVQPGQGSDA